MEEPSNKKQRFDGDEVEATILETTEIDDEATAKAEEDAREREEEEKVAKVTVRMKGIPFEGVTESDIAAFFDDCEIAEEGIFIAPLTRVAYVEFKDEPSVELALKKGHNFQGRSISISKAKPFHRTKDIGVAAAAEHFSEAPFSADSVVIQIRFLPYWTTEDRVMEFYKDFEVLAIHMVWDHIGRTGAQCFVEFTSVQDQRRALQMKGLGRQVRFFEFEHAKLDEMFAHLHPIIDDGALVIKMDSLPWNITADDIYLFLKEINITGVYISKNWFGKNTGIGFLTVATHEQAFKVWDKSGQRIGVVGGKKVPYRESKIIELAASCPTELTSTLISMYVREKDALDRFNTRGYNNAGFNNNRYTNNNYSSPNTYGGHGGGAQGDFHGNTQQRGRYGVGGLGVGVGGLRVSGMNHTNRGGTSRGGAFSAFQGRNGAYGGGYGSRGWRK